MQKNNNNKKKNNVNRKNRWMLKNQGKTRKITLRLESYGNKLTLLLLVPSLACSTQPNKHQLSAPAFRESTSQFLQVGHHCSETPAHHLMGWGAEGWVAE